MRTNPTISDRTEGVLVGKKSLAGVGQSVLNQVAPRVPIRILAPITNYRLPIIWKFLKFNLSCNVELFPNIVISLKIFTGP